MEEEEEEIQIQTQIKIEAQPVTVAAPPPPPQNILTLALPIQHPRTTASGGGGGGGREDCWSEGATSTLIEAWGERYVELSRGNLKQQHWKDVADIVSSREDFTKTAKTDVQCKNRIDTLKKKYKIEKGKIVSGQGPSKWVFFHRLDRLIGANAAAAKITGLRIPVGIPVGGAPRLYQRPGAMDTDSSSSSSDAPPSPDSLPPESFNHKRPRSERRRRRDSYPSRKNAKSWGDSIRELSQAIMEFGDSYERIETSKLEQVVEMEKQRMGFAKDLELQRMHFFINTQLELTQLKRGEKVNK